MTNLTELCCYYTACKGKRSFNSLRSLRRHIRDHHNGDNILPFGQIRNRKRRRFKRDSESVTNESPRVLRVESVGDNEALVQDSNYNVYDDDYDCDCQDNDTEPDPDYQVLREGANSNFPLHS